MCYSFQVKLIDSLATRCIFRNPWVNLQSEIFSSLLLNSYITIEFQFLNQRDSNPF